MGILDYILQMMRIIEAWKPGVICYAYLSANKPQTHIWYHVVISDVDTYLNDKRFKALSNAFYHEALRRYGYKVIFVAATPTEETLVKLAEDGNLLMVE